MRSPERWEIRLVAGSLVLGFGLMVIAVAVLQVTACGVAS